jgi:hypothetical protein
MKIMCHSCGRTARQPHAQNCPELTGLPIVRAKKHPNEVKRKTGAYLRRGRHAAATPFPNTIYLVETRKPADDTPEAMFWEMHQFPFNSNQPPEPRRDGMLLPHPTKGVR